MKSKKLKIEGMILEIPPYVYEPAEDTFLLLDALSVSPGEKCLDVGTGSGILAIKMAKEGGEVIATDIDIKAILTAKKNSEENGVKVEFVRCDLAAPIYGKFDKISFNPPYLPFDDEIPESVWWSGGKEIIGRFLKRDLPRILRRGGEAYLVYSSLSGVSDLGELLPPGMSWKKLKEEKFDFERIYLVKVCWNESGDRDNFSVWKGQAS